MFNIHKTESEWNKTENVANFLAVSSTILIPSKLHVLVATASYNTHINPRISEPKSTSQ
jgi:hypothetical protein